MLLRYKVSGSPLIEEITVFLGKRFLPHSTVVFAHFSDLVNFQIHYEEQFIEPYYLYDNKYTF